MGTIVVEGVYYVQANLGALKPAARLLQVADKMPKAWPGEPVRSAISSLGAMVSRMWRVTDPRFILRPCYSFANLFADAFSMDASDYLSSRSKQQFEYAVGLVLVALSAIGASRALFTDRGWLQAGLEMLSIGALAASVAYGVRILGSSLTGGGNPGQGEPWAKSGMIARRPAPIGVCTRYQGVPEQYICGLSTFSRAGG